jgi:DNA-directed RNA polymerase specialized sigma24 family protein
MNRGAVSDNELMTRFYGCNDLAFEEILRDWWPKVFAYFRRRGWSEADADELTQEVFLRLFVTKHRIGGRYASARS